MFSRDLISPQRLWLPSLFAALLAAHRICRRLRTLTYSLLTPEPGYFTEPGVAVNPNNPQQVVAVFQDNVHAA